LSACWFNVGHWSLSGKWKWHTCCYRCCCQGSWYSWC